MATQRDDSALVSFYTKRITEPSTSDEVYGYWLFALGLVASAVGVALFMYSSTLVDAARPSVHEPHLFWTVRQAAIVLAAGGVPLILGGIAVRLPLRRIATRLAYLGVAICLAALAWFLVTYPANWSLAGGNTGVIGLYTLGIAIIGLASVVAPMLSGVETETASERTAREKREAEEAEIRNELTETREERDEARAAADSAAAELEALRESRARFEIYQDKGGGYRWRLRHRNGNVISDSGQGYASRQKCQQGMHSVMRNALGAAVMRIDPDDPEQTAGETETDPIEIESQATFEIYEDDAGEHRWRLRHDNGNILADSGEGYASRQKARQGADSVRNNAADADIEERQ